LALTLYTHLVGLNRGSSDFVPVGRQQSTAFYNFHPDKETLIRTALDFTDPLASPLTANGTLSLYLLKFALIGHAPVDLDTPQDAALIFIRIIPAHGLCGSVHSRSTQPRKISARP